MIAISKKIGYYADYLSFSLFTFCLKIDQRIQFQNVLTVRDSNLKSYF
jgi:hypothetical protein